MKFLLCLPALLLSLMPAAGQTFGVDIDVDDPPEGIFSEEWSEMYINGSKVGYTHTVLERQGEEILTLEDSFMKMGRGDTAITTISTSKTREKLDGTPISMVSVNREGQRTKTQRVKFSPDGAHVETTDNTRSWSRDIELDPGFVLSWSYVRELEKRNLQPGETLENQIYVPDLVLDRTLPVSTTVIGEENVTVDGKKVPSTKIQQTLQLGFLPLKLTAWIETDGTLLRMNMPLGGMDITLLGSDEARAKSSFSPPDLFTNTLIPLNKAIPDNAETVTFLVQSNGKIVEGLPDSAYQSVKRIDQGTFEVTVQRGELQFAGNSPVDDVYLQPSPLVDFEDPAIAELIENAGLDELSPEDQVRELVRIADEAISIKSMDMGFATASETVALSEGDCTEHALLLTALGRAAGIPTRGASGVVYFLDADGQPTMGYHMWAQFWNGSQWLDIDAAFGTAEPAPIRILFSTTDLMDPSLTEDVLTLSQYLGQTQIEVSSVSMDR